jgi:rubrerythrin
MAPLTGSRNGQNTRPAFSDAGRFNRLARTYTREAAAEGRPDGAQPAKTRCDQDGGHLDFLVAGYDTSPLSGNPLGSTVAGPATAIAAMTGNQNAMYAGTACTAHDEGFEETAGWFEMMAKTGRSHAGEMRRALDNLR